MPQKLITVNLNDHIEFKPTTKGIFLMADRLIKKSNVEGWYEMQIWEFMKLFGEHMGNGFDLVVETTVRIETT